MMSTASAQTPLDRVVDALTAAGCNPKGGGRKRTARCPAHEDRNPSLSVAESDNGSALVYCHAGCTTADVAQALGLHLADLFPDKPPREAPLSVVGRLKAAYHYHDANGELIYRNVRYEPKTFRLERWDVTQFKPGLAGVKRVLYHLPQVRRAVNTGRTIMVLEGEKDVENAQWLDVVATTSGGATSWQDHYAEDLAGATRVVVCVDDDPEGHAYGRAVVRSLRGRVERLTVVRPTRGKDLTAHLAAGGTKRDLATLWDSENEPDWRWLEDVPEGVPPADGLPVPIDWPAFWNEDHSTAEWLVEPLIPDGRQVVLYAPAKMGKSLLALELAAAVATGRPVLRQPAGEGRDVIYLDLEMTEADLQERLIELGYGPDDDLSKLHYYLLPSLPPLDTAEGGIAVAALLDRHGARLVIIDTMARVVAGGENDADTYRDFYRCTGILIRQAGAALLRLDHAGKDASKGQRGSSAKEGDIDLVWLLKVDENGIGTLDLTHRRVGWVPQHVALQRHEEPLLRHEVQGGGEWPAGTSEVAALLDLLHVPVDCSTREAQTALQKAGEGRRRSIVAAACKWRREAGTTREPPTYPQVPGDPEPDDERPF